MISRRHFVQAAMATSALYGASGFGNWSRLAAQQVLSQDDLIGSSDFGNVTLIHITDIHAQTQPIYFREPEFNIGVGLAEGAAAASGRRRLPRGLRHRDRAVRWITR
jgi:sulfur-oxidizing protein SoxB